MRKSSVFLVGGARPNFMKVGPIFKALARAPKFKTTIVHTGQHYDRELSYVFFEELGLPSPGVRLEVGSGSHAVQTARIMERFEGALFSEQPDLVIVVGDVNSSLACALAATKVVYPSGARPKLAHVEAGLRSFDRSMPEEINRLLTDAIGDFLFTTEESANANLAREGVPEDKIFFVGNVMIDSLLGQLSRADSSKIRERLGVTDGRYALLTLHRPSNLETATLLALMRTMEEIASRIPVIFPAHPRTVARLREFGLDDRCVWVAPDEEISAGRAFYMLPPLGYLDFLNLMRNAAFVLTDSGGIQEETTILGVPCLTLRENTERPVTLSHGTNVLVGSDPQRIHRGVEAALTRRPGPTRTPPLWDGKAAERIVKVLGDIFS